MSSPDVQRLVAAIAPGALATDLGGTFSLNVGLAPAGLVLRVQQPFVTRGRMLAVQAVRHFLAGKGLVVPVALRWRGSTVFRCGKRWAEMEGYIPHHKPPKTPASYLWLFGAMGTLHRELATLDLPCRALLSPRTGRRPRCCDGYQSPKQPCGAIMKQLRACSCSASSCDNYAPSGYPRRSFRCN